MIGRSVFYQNASYCYRSVFWPNNSQVIGDKAQNTYQHPWYLDIITRELTFCSFFISVSLVVSSLSQYLLIFNKNLSIFVKESNNYSLKGKTIQLTKSPIVPGCGN